MTEEERRACFDAEFEKAEKKVKAGAGFRAFKNCFSAPFNDDEETLRNVYEYLRRENER